MKTLQNQSIRIALLITLVMTAVPGIAQPAGPGFNRLRSPVVNEDHSVTFSLNAPNASEVELMFGPDYSAKEFQKDEEGIWKLTIAPLEPDLYTYGILVDGLRIVDPLNPRIQCRSRT